MYLIQHFLFWLMMSIGFLLGTLIKGKHRILIMFCLCGLSLGVFNHLYQDSLYYSQEGFMDSVVYLKPHTVTPVTEAICSILTSNQTYCQQQEDKKITDVCSSTVCVGDP